MADADDFDLEHFRKLMGGDAGKTGEKPQPEKPQAPAGRGGAAKGQKASAAKSGKAAGRPRGGGGRRTTPRKGRS